MTTIKHPVSAAATARLLSRILRENGFHRAIIARGGLRKTEGFYVQRISYSNTVRVNYHTDDETSARSKVAQMREVLFELGFISTHPHAIYIQCQHP